MKNTGLVVALIIIATAMSACVPAAIATYAYHDVGQTDARQKFMAEYNKNNIEREKAGLQPLDLCTEKRHFDEDWANDDPACKKENKAKS